MDIEQNNICILQRMMFVRKRRRQREYDKEW